MQHGLDVLFHAALVVAQLLGRGAGGIQLAAQAGWRFVTVDDDDLAMAEVVGERDRLVEGRRGARRAVVPEHDRVRHPPSFLRTVMVPGGGGRLTVAVAGPAAVVGPYALAVAAEAHHGNDVALGDLRERGILAEEVVALVDVVGDGDALSRGCVGSAAHDALKVASVDAMVVHHVPAAVEADEGRRHAPLPDDTLSRSRPRATQIHLAPTTPCAKGL